MEHESFEDEEVAQILNNNFVCIKVDKEERPDIDSIYMRVCQAMTGSGGWPTSVFLTSEQNPFYVGTYFPKGRFIQLLTTITKKWATEKEYLTKSSKDVIAAISGSIKRSVGNEENLSEKSFHIFRRSFDKDYGGFGAAPKFPSPHNLMFLLEYYESTKNKDALGMAEKTLTQMYCGGIFDHIGFGFSRYSTDKYWLAPHFEKMLYDNALLSYAYVLAYEKTGNELYKSVAAKVYKYIEREMTNDEGGFYSAQDADSDGVEGKYYVFTPDEIIKVLGKANGTKFNEYYDITEKGNFEGKSIPNLIKQHKLNENFAQFMPQLYEYRKGRTKLHLDNKILTSWNSLMIWSLAKAYQVFGDLTYLKMAEKAATYIEGNLTRSDTVYVGITDGKLSGKGFLDDYAFYILALTALYEATHDKKYLQLALALNEKVVEDYFDNDEGGFFLNGLHNELLIIRPKETYDGAIPSGNSAMAYNLNRLYKHTKSKWLYNILEKQNKFMASEAYNYPSGYSFYMLSTLPTKDIVCVLKNKSDLEGLKIKTNWVLTVLDEETREYPLINNKTTFYVCEGNSCKPPTNEL